MKLQTILYPTENICNEEALYLHREEGFLLFDGYFNLFYLDKHHKYCDLKGLSLELTVRGIRRIVLMHDRQEIGEKSFEDMPISGMDRLRGKTNVLDQDTRVSLKLPYEEYKTGVFWFKAEPVDMDGDWEIQGHFEAEVAEATVLYGAEAHAGSSTGLLDVKNGDEVSGDKNVMSRMMQEAGGGQNAAPSVELAINICTFRREPYVKRNMKALTSWLSTTDIDSRTPEAAEHMHVFIVDNGQTLEKDDEFMGIIGKESRIRVIPNANTGGTGGFSRGMLEAIDKREELGLTHLLMMDDDAVFDPDLFTRLYGFLSTLRPEYKGITVGGALMREDHRYIQHAAGEWYEGFKVRNDHPLVDMRSFETCTESWVTGENGHGASSHTQRNGIDGGEQSQGVGTSAHRKTGASHDLYGAWWCCCYNMDAITKENIPLPIFVHHDDIQFGLKQRDRGIVFLNGVCVWHQGFELVFPGVKQYYNMRNTLITSAQFEPDFLRSHVKWWAVKRYIGMLVSYRYGDCEFVYRGLMDFLKGRQWLMDSDPELIHKQLMADYERICPRLFYEQIREYVDAVPQELSPDQLRSYYTWERFRGSLWKKITFNGWFLSGDDELKVLTPLDSPWDTYRHKRVLLYDPGSKRGTLMKRSNKEFFKGIGRMIRMCVAVDAWKAKGGQW
ncbi:glycosyltransferase [Butyrivibrio sp. AE2032]|uniref:glycosyltransferase n=1 Tax=Butyrivibrio sp. AE2032 TaxID=1458463 RepID=UPI00054F8853|nr:glycosyltransferase [Butyrivibrio sp. AE2032]